MIYKVKMEIGNIIQFIEMECESTQELIERIIMNGIVIEDVQYIPDNIWIKKPEMKKWAKL